MIGIEWKLVAILCFICWSYELDQQIGLFLVLDCVEMAWSWAWDIAHELKWEEKLS